MNARAYDFSHWSGGLPKVSCLCPTYGRPHLIGEAVASFLQQDYPGEKELIVLNDHPEIPLSLPPLPGVVVINATARYSSLGEKRNALAALATGDIFFPWDDDDISLPWRLSLTLERMVNLHYYKPRDLWSWTGNGVSYWDQVMAHAMAGYSRELFDKVGGYPPMNSGEDQEIERKIWDAGLSHITPLGRENAFYLYRLNHVHTYHISAHAYGGGWEECAAEVADALEPGSRSIVPVWNKPYSEIVARHLDVTKKLLQWDSGRPLLSVCIALKNRSREAVGDRTLQLFPECVKSLVRAARSAGPVELVVADFGSDDWPLEEWLPAAAEGISIRVIQVDGPFSRGRGLNMAAAAATSANLLISDADVLVDGHAIHDGLAALGRGLAWFPKIQKLTAQGHPDAIEVDGFGISFVSKALFKAAGGIPEFTSWGGEDNVFHQRISKLTEVLRSDTTGLRHQWHPEVWRDRHYQDARGADYYHWMGQNGNRSVSRAVDPEEERGVLRIFSGSHPAWNGPLHFFAPDVVCRPGLDFGRYEIREKERVILAWDSWPPETLYWIEEENLYRCAASSFTLAEIGSPSADI